MTVAKPSAAAAAKKVLNAWLAERSELIEVHRLPGYSPELNPAEHLWKSLRQDCFANRTLSSLDAVERTLVKGLLDLERDADRTQSMTGFNWITSISLKAN